MFFFEQPVRFIQVIFPCSVAADRVAACEEAHLASFCANALESIATARWDPENSVRDDIFWLSDKQWEAVSARLPQHQKSPRRVSDRTIVSGIFHVLQSGCVWRACPAEYGPYMTVCNRFHRWKQRGIWQGIAAALDRDAGAAASLASSRAPLGPAKIAAQRRGGG